MTINEDERERGERGNEQGNDVERLVCGNKQTLPKMKIECVRMSVLHGHRKKQ